LITFLCMLPSHRWMYVPMVLLVNPFASKKWNYQWGKHAGIEQWETNDNGTTHNEQLPFRQ
jgi:hypothetical protein